MNKITGKQLLEKLEYFYETQPEKTAFFSEGTKGCMTYGELDRISGKIHGALKKAGLGREAIVVILMPRGIEILAAMIGCWRAGCACIVCEASMAADRIRYIIADSGSRFTLTTDIYEKMQNEAYLPGFEAIDAHDAAYLVYTSGSTGNPKGVLHEFGNLDQSLTGKSMDGRQMARPTDVVAINAPLNFVAAPDWLTNFLSVGASVLLMQMKDVKNPARLKELYEKYGVTCTFMTPSLFRSIPEFNSQLEFINLGGEPCSNIYRDKPRLYNGYNMSEAGRDMMIFPIDKAYPLTPVGKNQGDEEILLLDEDGQKVADGETGEICFANLYVRGYIGQAKEKSTAWKNGIFHTGDLGKRLPDGNIILQGRNDDMIKINGNRIEPAEIERVARNLFDLSWVCAKGFVTERNSFIVLYYQGTADLDPASAREGLGSMLPGYMVPSYFVKLDQVPLLPNGKLNKKALLAPDVSDYRAVYRAPETELEKRLISIFETVLEMDHIGTDDDFYNLGGDSLRSIRVVMEFENPALDVMTIYRCRTVRKIAEAIKEEYDKGTASSELRDEKAREHDQPLLPFEIYLLDYQLYSPRSTLCNMPQFWKLPKAEVDQDRLRKAFETLYQHHPLLRSRITLNERMEFVRRLNADEKPVVTIEQVTEAQLMNDIAPGLVYPFRLVDESLFRLRIFETEESIYIFLDMHHVFSDGTSLQVLEHNLSEAYYGRPLKRDYSYLYARDMNKQIMSENYLEAKAYHEKRYGSRQWTRNFTPDMQSRDNRAGIIRLDASVSRREIDAFLQKKEISLNMLGCAAALLCIHRHEKANDVLVSWLYHGRDSILYQDCIGLLIREPAIGISFDEIHSKDELLNSVKEQASDGMRYSIYPYILASTDIAVNDTFRVRNQGNLRGATCIEGIPLEILTLPDTRTASFMMDMQLVDREDGELEFWFVYNSCCYHDETARSVADLYNSCIHELVTE